MKIGRDTPWYAWYFTANGMHGTGYPCRTHFGAWLATHVTSRTRGGWFGSPKLYAAGAYPAGVTPQRG